MLVTTPPASAASAPVSRRHSSRPRRSAPVQARGVPVCESESSARKRPFTPSTWLACPCGPSVTGAQLCPSAVKPANWLPTAPYPSVPRSSQAKKPAGERLGAGFHPCGSIPRGEREWRKPVARHRRRGAEGNESIRPGRHGVDPSTLQEIRAGVARDPVVSQHPPGERVLKLQPARATRFLWLLLVRRANLTRSQDAELLCRGIGVRADHDIPGRPNRSAEAAHLRTV